MISPVLDPDYQRSKWQCPECGAWGRPTRCRWECPVCEATWTILPQFRGVCIDPLPFAELRDGRVLYHASRLGSDPCQYQISTWNGVSGEDVCITETGQWFRRGVGASDISSEWQEFIQACERKEAQT